MKRIIIATLILLALFLSSCNKEEVENTNDNTITASDISIENTKNELSSLDALSETIVYSKGSENALDEDYFDYYFSDSSLLEDISDYVYFTSATTSVCEAGVFKVKDAETKEALLSAFETRKENLISTYENYSPEDVEVAENMIKGSFDDVVWFVMTKENQSVKEVIEK